MIDSLTVKSIVWVIWFHFVSSQYIRILLYKVSQFLKNVFLLNKNRKHVSENRDEPVRIVAASFGRKTMLLPQVFWAVLKIYLGDRSQICRKHVVFSSEIGSPKFILWAIFRDEFRRPNQCLVTFGDCATSCLCDQLFPALLTHSLIHPSIHSSSHYHQKGAEQWTILFNIKYNILQWSMVLEIAIFATKIEFFSQQKDLPIWDPHLASVRTSVCPSVHP